MFYIFVGKSFLLEDYKQNWQLMLSTYGILTYIFACKKIKINGVCSNSVHTLMFHPFIFGMLYKQKTVNTPIVFSPFHL